MRVKERGYFASLSTFDRIVRRFTIATTVSLAAVTIPSEDYLAAVSEFA
jgi:hypothetical protein